MAAAPKALALLVAVLARAPWLAVAVSLRRGQTFSLRRGQTFSRNVDYAVKLENVLGVQYHGAFQAGDQTLPVIYDTGSFEIVLLSTLCGPSCIDGKTVYNSNLSSSFTASDHTMKVLYASGSATSRKGFESVRIGDESSPYVLKNAAFWQVVEHQIPVWNRGSFSGIIGLSYLDYVPEGFRGEETGNTNATKDKLLIAGLGIKSFAICLQRGGVRPPGVLALGPKVDSYTKHAGFMTVPVAGKVHWGLKMTGVFTDTPAHNSLNISNPCNPSCGAIVDSGTSFIAVPSSAKPLVKAIERILKSDCRNVKHLPVLRLEFGDVIAELPPTAYVMRIGRYCTSAFMDMDSMSAFGPVWILGMPFFRWYYTVFDRENKQIHISRSTPKCGVDIEENPASPSTISGTATPVHFGAAASGVYTRRTFTEADFEPMEADPSAAMKPPPSMSFAF